MKLKRLREFVKNNVKDVPVPAHAAAFFYPQIQDPRITLLEVYIDRFDCESEDSYVSFEDFSAFVKKRNSLVKNLFSDDYFNSNKEHVSFFKVWKNEPECIFYLELMQNIFLEQSIVSPLEILEQLVQSLTEIEDRNALSVVIGYLIRQKQQHITQGRAQAEDKELKEAKTEVNHSELLLNAIKAISQRLNRFKNTNEVTNLLNAFFSYFPFYHHSLSAEHRQLFKPVGIQKLAEFLTEHRYAYLMPLFRNAGESKSTWQAFADLMQIMPEEQRQKIILKIIHERITDSVILYTWQMANIANAFGRCAELIPLSCRETVVLNLLPALSSKDSELTEAAIAAFGRLGKVIPTERMQEVTNGMLLKLSESDAGISEQAIETLGQLGQVIPKNSINDVLSALLKILKDQSNSFRRIAAVQALVQLRKDILKFRTDIPEEKQVEEKISASLQELSNEIGRLANELPAIKDIEVLRHVMEILSHSIELIPKPLCEKITLHLIENCLEEEKVNNDSIYAAEALAHFKKFIPEISYKAIAENLIQKLLTGDVVVRTRIAEILPTFCDLFQQDQINAIVSNLLDQIERREEEGEARNLLIQLSPFITNCSDALRQQVITTLLKGMVVRRAIAEGPCLEFAVGALLRLGVLTSESTQETILTLLTTPPPAPVVNEDDDLFFQDEVVKSLDEEVNALKVFLLAKIEKEGYVGMLKSVPIIYGFLNQHLKTCRDYTAQVALISAVSELHAACMNLERARVAAPLLQEQHGFPRELGEIVRSYKF